MATNLNIDETLLAEALKLGGKKTKRETVNEALEEYIRRRQQKAIISIFGKIEFKDGYNHKQLRRQR